LSANPFQRKPSQLKFNACYRKLSLKARAK
jgi:hypothetical protein